MNKIFKLLVFPSLLMLVVAISCSNNSASESKKEIASVDGAEQSATEVEVIYMTTEQFKKEIFDYTTEKEWKYKGKTPCVVDFYADWCGPCKKVAPIMEELAKQYKGKIKFYKVNTDKEKELAGAFGISGIPSILFVPQAGQPQMTSGAYPKEEYIKMIDQIIYGKK